MFDTPTYIVYIHIYSTFQKKCSRVFVFSCWLNFGIRFHQASRHYFMIKIFTSNLLVHKQARILHMFVKSLITLIFSGISVCILFNTSVCINWKYFEVLVLLRSIEKFAYSTLTRIVTYASGMTTLDRVLLTPFPLFLKSTSIFYDLCTYGTQKLTGQLVFLR